MKSISFFFGPFGALLAVLASPVWGQVPLNPLPSRVVGQTRTSPAFGQVNLVEGRELNAPGAVAVDPGNGIVWVSDTGNNRVLGWRNYLGFENGATADFVLGQRDLVSTNAQGPGTSFSSGLNQPTGLAVDARGNVYVADSANNRIIRYANPAAQPGGEPVLADLVIGQSSLSSRFINSGGLSEKSLYFVFQDSQVLRVGLAFDAQGNLWTTDPGNSRVLRYPAAALGEGASSNPAATLVLGQLDFRTNAILPEDPDIRIRGRKDGVRQPAGIAFDAAGRLYVCDSLARVVVYRPPFTSGMDAARVMGIVQPPPPNSPLPRLINEQSLGFFAPSVGFRSADGVFTAGNTVFVVDTWAHRILRFAAFDQWPAETTQFSPTAQAIIGQDAVAQTEPRINRALPEPTNASLFAPVNAVFVGGETFVVDSGNNRLIVMGDLTSGPLLSAGPPYTARRVLGQLSFEYRAPNLIEGREFNAITGIAIDSVSNPPRLYVADTSNNRILGFADARRVRPGDRADVVIGQPDFFRSVLNYPFNSLDSRDDASLAGPTGLAIDNDGNLWVADRGNARVLRFPSPFNQRNIIEADIVLGQSSMTARVTDPTARTMGGPFGLAFSSGGLLFVSDIDHNRVLMFDPPFVNGAAAARVFGQPDFSSTLTGTTDNRFNGVRGIALDSDDRLYVCDNLNSRVSLFTRAPSAGLDPQASFKLTREVNQPLTVFANKITGEVWVAGQSTIALRFPDFNRLLILGDSPEFRLTVNGGRAIAQDQFGALYLADFLNRVALHYPGNRVVNAANQIGRIAPGMIASLLPVVQTQVFTEETSGTEKYPQSVSDGGGTSYPLPNEVLDLQVLVDDKPTPLFYVSPSLITFQVPNGAPTTGNVEVQVFRPSQQRIVASQQIRMDVAAPGLFTVNGSGNGAVIALNEDGTVNSRQEAVARGKVVKLFATGQGFVPDAPPDGTPPTGPVPTASLPRVFAGGTNFVPDANIVYSGLAPGLVGVWEIDVKIPETVPPGETIVVLVANDVASNDQGRLRHTIFVKAQ